jgi:hypothetical protein
VTDLTDALQPGENWQQSVERRLKALDTKTPALGDLPMAALQRKLENDWQPDGSVLLQPGSVTFDAVDLSILGVTGQQAKRKLALGTSTATWPGGGATGAGTITHGLGVVPIVVFYGSRNALIEYESNSRDATNIGVTGYVTSNVAFGPATLTFDWMAIG